MQISEFDDYDIQHREDWTGDVFIAGPGCPEMELPVYEAADIAAEHLHSLRSDLPSSAELLLPLVMVHPQVDLRALVHGYDGAPIIPLAHIEGDTVRLDQARIPLRVIYTMVGEALRYELLRAAEADNLPPVMVQELEQLNAAELLPRLAGIDPAIVLG